MIGRFISYFSNLTERVEARYAPPVEYSEEADKNDNNKNETDFLMSSPLCSINPSNIQAYYSIP